VLFPDPRHYSEVAPGPPFGASRRLRRPCRLRSSEWPAP